MSGAIAQADGPRPAPFLLGFVIAGAGLLLSAFAVRDTVGHVDVEAASPPAPEPARRASFAAAAQAGLVTNLNDAMAWGLLPLFLTAEGFSLHRVAVVAAAYPLAWALAQPAFGALSDRIGRKPLASAGMWVQAAAVAAFAGGPPFRLAVWCAIAMGLGTAMAYPTLLAVVGDVTAPRQRAAALGAYRLWRDAGYAAGALLVGVAADVAGARAAILLVAAVTAASGAYVVARMRETLRPSGARAGAEVPPA